MGKTNIPWAHFTFNPWIGCTEQDESCSKCYARVLMQDRYGRVKWGKGQPRSRTSANNWKLPYKWNRDAEKAGAISRVFCASLADWLDDDNVPIEWLVDLLELIRTTPYLTWLMLSKRLQNWHPRMYLSLAHSTGALSDWIQKWIDGEPPANVQMGVSIPTEEYVKERCDLLLSIPALIRFVSHEPALGPVNFRPWLATGKLHQIITGGESGESPRPYYLEWAEDVISQCRQHGASPFVKQMGGHPILLATGRILKFKDRKGEDMSEWPPNLQIREFPQIPDPMEIMGVTP